MSHGAALLIAFGICVVAGLVVLAIDSRYAKSADNNDDQRARKASSADN